MDNVLFFLKFILKKIIFNINLVMGVEYNDFLVFPFDLTMAMPESAENILKKGCQILERLNVKYCLSDGTLLGVYRDNKLISHDTDIDIAVLKPVDAKAILREFRKEGFKCGRKVIACEEIQQLVFYSMDNVVFDIIFYTKIGDCVFSFNEKDYYFKHQAKHYTNTLAYKYSNHVFYIPSETEEWLENVYGKDWKIPKQSKPNDWREGGNEYLMAFPYDGNVKKLIKSLKENQ